MSAFFEIALKDNKGYIPLFRDYRRIQEWLPEDIFINRFEDTTFRVVSDFDEDVDVTTTTLKGGRIRCENLAVWREENLGFRRGGTKENNVVVLGWQHPEPEDSESKPEQPESEESEKEEMYFAIELPEEPSSNLGLVTDAVLVFSLAEADEEPPEPEDEEDSGDENNQESDKDNKKKKKEKEAKKKDKQEEEEKEPLEWSVELIAADGQAVRLPLSRFRAVPPILKTRYTKFKDESNMYGKAYEPTLQVFELPLSDFVESFPEFRPGQLRTIRFVFDESPKGVIILDRLGFANK
jgi:hypothetical protein